MLEDAGSWDEYARGRGSYVAKMVEKGNLVEYKLLEADLEDTTKTVIFQ